MDVAAIRTIGVKIQNGAEGLLNALPALYGLKEKYPAAKITVGADQNALACSDMFAKEFECLGYADFNQRSFDLRPDEVINPWSLYEKSVAEKNVINPFHKIDLLKLRLGVFQIDIIPALQIASEEIEAMSLRLNPEAHTKVLFDVSAFSTKRSAYLVNAILSQNSHCRIYFYGTLKERSSSTNILGLVKEELRHRCWDFTGSTTVRELSCLIHLSDVVMGRPGTATQIAAQIGTQAICILPEHGWSHDRIPYASGHILFRPRLNGGAEENACLDALANICCFPISRESANPVTEMEWASFFEGRIEQDLLLYTSYLTQVHSLTGKEGSYTQLFLLPLIYMGAEPAQALSSIYRLLWLYSLAGVDCKAPDLEILHSETIDSMRSLLPTVENLAQLAAFGQKYSQFIENSLRRGLFERARKDGEQLSEVDRLLAMLAINNPELTPLVNYLRAEQDQINTHDPLQAAADMAACYRLLQERILIFLDLVQTIFQKNTTPIEEAHRHGESIY